jgi:hypothetical protein
MHATHAGTGIHALVAHAGQHVRTVGIDGALGLALHIGVALEARQAGAGRRTAPVPAFSVNTAGRRPARVNDLWSGAGRCKRGRVGKFQIAISTCSFQVPKYASFGNELLMREDFFLSFDMNRGCFVKKNTNS